MKQDVGKQYSQRPHRVLLLAVTVIKEKSKQSLNFSLKYQPGGGGGHYR